MTGRIPSTSGCSLRWPIRDIYSSMQQCQRSVALASQIVDTSARWFPICLQILTSVAKLAAEVISVPSLRLFSCPSSTEKGCQYMLQSPLQRHGVERQGHCQFVSLPRAPSQTSFLLFLTCLWRVERSGELLRVERSG